MLKVAKKTIIQKWQQVFITLLFLFISSIVLYPVLKPFILQGTPFTYDGNLHLFRLAAFHKAITEGNIPPSWSSQIAFGYGSPVIMFYWTLSYWLAEPFIFLGYSLTDSQKLAVIISIILSFFTMFIFLKSFFEKWSALVGAIFYSVAPFPFYSMYTFGTTGTTLVLALWPLMFLIVLRMKYVHPKLSLVLGGVCIALTVIAHHVMFLMIFPIWISFVMLTSYLHRSYKILVHSAFMFILGLGLSAYFWLPALIEKKYIRIDEVWLGAYKSNFVTLAQILSHPRYNPLPGDDWWKTNFATGWPQLAAPILALLLVVILVFVHKKKSLLYLFQLNLLFAIFFLISLFLVTQSSAVIWSLSSVLKSFQGPVRFQALALFTSSILAGSIVYVLKKYRAIVALMLISLCLFLNVSYIPSNRERINWPDWWYKSGDSTTDAFGEFLPIWTDTNNLYGKLRHENIVVRTNSNSSTVSQVVKKSTSISFDVDIPKGPETIVLDQLYFPGWRIWVDGKEVPVVIDTVGRLSFHLRDSRAYHIDARFTDTPIHRFAKFISAISIVIILTLLIQYLIMVKKKNLAQKSKNS